MPCSKNIYGKIIFIFSRALLAYLAENRVLVLLAIVLVEVCVVCVHWANAAYYHTHAHALTNEHKSCDAHRQGEEAAKAK